MTAQTPLTGTWTLLDWVNTDADGQVTHPFGPHPTGLICYAPSGHFFVHIARADRPCTTAPDPFSGTPAEDSAAMKSLISYAGTFTDRGDHVLHHVTHASHQPWVGGDQRREVQMSGDRLTLSAEGIMLAGKPVTARLDWQRAPDARSA